MCYLCYWPVQRYLCYWPVQRHSSRLVGVTGPGIGATLRSILARVTPAAPRGISRYCVGHCIADNSAQSSVGPRGIYRTGVGVLGHSLLAQELGSIQPSPNPKVMVRGAHQRALTLG